MHTVTILGFDQAYASAITGALDLFSLAGVSWQRMQGGKPEQQFKVQLASSQGKPIKCINQIQLQAQVALEDVRQTDILLVPTIGGMLEGVLERNRHLLPHIVHHHGRGSDIASNCSGAFFLAEAGILDGKEATTHWGYAELFKLRYPTVSLCPDKLITHDGNVFCSGGGMAWFDLSLLLIERYCGLDIATNTAKAHVIDLSRGNQAAYSSIKSRKYHQDRDIQSAQEWMEGEFAQPLQIKHLAARANMTERTFNRRFQRATGQSPLHYLKQLRIEAAKKRLETTQLTPQQITNQVGYEDISSFSRLFKASTGLTLIQYRNKFKR